MSAGERDRAALWARFGAPADQEGSVNDPRTREEHGIRFNEKWIYLNQDGGRRLVYWHRYNCRGVRVEDASGQVVGPPERRGRDRREADRRAGDRRAGERRSAG